MGYMKAACNRLSSAVVRDSSALKVGNAAKGKLTATKAEQLQDPRILADYGKRVRRCQMFLAQNCG